MRTRGMLVAIVSVLLVLILTMAAAQRQSPGPISSVHARLSELDGGESCAECHGGWFGDMQAACAECHEDIRLQIKEGHGLHGSLVDGQADACATCHSEHHGREFQLVNRLAFAQAGVADPRAFDHKIVGLDLAGAHDELDCSGCHEHAYAEVLPAGKKRFLGLSRDCASCHANPHGGQMQFGCATCHSQDTFTERFVPSHDRWLPLNGAHAAVDCRTCHASGTTHALEQLRAGHDGGARDCADCHESPHTEQFVAGNSQVAGLSPAAGCVVCHILDHEQFDDPGLQIDESHHRHAGFVLTSPHDQAACIDCHEADGTFAERHPGRSPDDCRTCHTDPHGGQFDSSALAQNDCISCHKRTHFLPHAFDAVMHARTLLPLDGAHAELECSGCHKVAAEGLSRKFHGTPSRCENCHQTAHGDAFSAHVARLNAEPRGQCATCHGTAEWASLDHERFDHRDWTGFSLDGAHSQIECTDCHARSDAPDEFGRRFGRIPEHAGAAANGGACARCHGDPHEGIFSGPEVPQAVDGRAGCLRCHETASFRTLPHGFDHAGFAGFELAGKHGQLDCSACHEALAATTSTGRTWGKAKGKECSDCHTDPHRGQFARVGRTDCRRCHKSSTTFATLSFRHNLDSRFRLGDQHHKVPCSLCHKQESKDGASFVRYKPLPTKCVDCHGREEGGASGRRRRR